MSPGLSPPRKATIRGRNEIRPEARLSRSLGRSVCIPEDGSDPLLRRAAIGFADPLPLPMGFIRDGP